MAPLLPKLRGRFAEFLNKGSPVRLRILSSPTCVGLRYGHLHHKLAAFLASVDSYTSLLYFGPYRASGLHRAYFTTRYPKRFARFYHQPGCTILLCHCLTDVGGTGISTSCPSPTTSVLGLGPDLPWADEPSPGNLGLSTCKFLACISLLIPAFSLLHRPQLLPVLLQPVHYAPLPLTFVNPKLRCRV